MSVFQALLRTFITVFVSSSSSSSSLSSENPHDKRKRLNQRDDSSNMIFPFLSLLVITILLSYYYSYSASSHFLNQQQITQLLPDSTLSLPISHPLPSHRQLGSAENSLFGIIAELDPIKGTLSFLIIVAAVLLVEFSFNGLTVSTNDTPFQKLIPYVQKELMVAGCTAFVFKVVVNATDGGLSEDWVIGLEYADLVVPIFSFVYCGFGIFLILIANRQCNEWSLAYRSHLVELCNDFFDFTLSWRYHYFAGWFPTKIINNVEFRIFHNIFCEIYQIQRNAFAFDQYVDKIFEIFVLEMIEIRPRDWIFVSLLFTMNLLRMAANVSFGEKCAETDYTCRDTALARLFTLGGGLLIVYSVFLASYTRYLKLRIMTKKGVKGINYYHKYLQDMESVQITEEKKRKGLDELKAAIDGIKIAKERRLAQSLGRFFTFRYWYNRIINRGKQFAKADRPPLSSSSLENHPLSEKHKELFGRWKSIADDVERELHSVQILQELRTSNSRQSSQLNSPLVVYQQQSTHNFSASSDQPFSPSLNPEGGSTRNTMVDARFEVNMQFPSQRLILSSLTAIHRGLSNGAVPASPHHIAKSSSKDQNPSSSRPAVIQEEGPVLSSSNIVTSEEEQQSPPNQQNLPTDKATTIPPTAAAATAAEEKEHKIQDDHINSTFPFNSPEIYFELIQILILIISLYSALWITDFVIVGPDLYKGLTAIPIFIACSIFISIIRTAALLKAVSEFDNDVMLEVLEETEGSKLLAKIVREKIVIRLRELAGNSNDISEGLTGLFRLFQQIDGNGNGLLSRDEFAEFLHAIDINFSRRKWNQIFCDIDISHDDKISFNEFFMFVFLHDNREVDEEEVVRVENLSKEVQKKRHLFERTLRANAASASRGWGCCSWWKNQSAQVSPNEVTFRETIHQVIQQEDAVEV